MGHLHVEDGVVHGLRDDDTEVDSLRRVERLQEVREASGIRTDLVEHIAELDDVTRALGDLHLDAVLHQPHELRDGHLELLGSVPERLDRRPHPSDVAVVIGAPHIDEQIEAALKL